MEQRVVGHDADRVAVDAGQAGDPGPAVRGAISKNEPSSTTSSMSRRASWTCRGSLGTSEASSSARRSTGIGRSRLGAPARRRSTAGTRGSGGSAGTRPPRRSARLSTTPLTRVWICGPPRSSLVMSSPSAALTTGGPPGKTWRCRDHHVPVGQRRVQRADAGGRAEHRRHHRHGAQQLDVDVSEAVAVGQVGAARASRSCARCRRRRRAGGRTAAATPGPARWRVSSSPRPPCSPPPEPPRTVKSPAVTTTLRPSTRHIPSTLPSGVNADELAVVVVARLAPRPPNCGTCPGRRAAGCARGRSACRCGAGGRRPRARPSAGRQLPAPAQLVQFRLTSSWPPSKCTPTRDSKWRPPPPPRDSSATDGGWGCMRHLSRISSFGRRPGGENGAHDRPCSHRTRRRRRPHRPRPARSPQRDERRARPAQTVDAIEQPARTPAPSSITGTDPAFCAGLDLRDLGVSRRCATCRTSRPPPPPPRCRSIAAVNGPAVTGGFELALACDFMIASERARFADTHLRVGVYPGPVLVDLPRRVGPAWARQMSLTGNFVDAETALRIGLVNQVVAHDDLLPYAIDHGPLDRRAAPRHGGDAARGLDGYGSAAAGGCGAACTTSTPRVVASARRLAPTSPPGART